MASHYKVLEIGGKILQWIHQKVETKKSCFYDFELLLQLLLQKALLVRCSLIG